MKYLLIVDDEESFLLSLIDLLKEHEEKFMIVSANNGKEAIEVLRSQSIDLVITDLKMPEMDGYQLLATISSEKPHVPVIVMTAFGTPEIEDEIMEMGAFQFIEKPIDFDVLLSKIMKGMALGSEGHITGFSIASFLQLLEHEKKSCTLVVKSKGRKGVLYFQQGNLINARTGSVQGLDAALEIVCWNHPEIEIQNKCGATEQLIEEPLGYILIEGSRLRDEKRNNSPMEGRALEEEMDDLELNDLGPLHALPNAGFALPGEEDELPDAKIDNALANAIMASGDIERLIMLSRDGKVLASRNFDERMAATSLAFIKVLAEQMRDIGGFTGPHRIVITLKDNQKIVVTELAQTIFGLEVGGSTPVDSIPAMLAKVVAKTQVN